MPADAPPQPLRNWPAAHNEAEQEEQSTAPGLPISIYSPASATGAGQAREALETGQ